MQIWVNLCLTQSRSRTSGRGRSRSPERSRTGRRRPGRWSGRRLDTSSSPFYHTDRPTPTHPPSWPHTPGDLQIQTHTLTHSVAGCIYPVGFPQSNICIMHTNASLFKTQGKHKGAPFSLVRRKRRREIVTLPTVFQCDTFLHVRQRNKGHNNFPGREFHFHILKPAFSFVHKLQSSVLLFGLSVTFYRFFDYMLHHCRVPL